MGQDPYSETQWLLGHSLYHATWIPNSIFPYPLPLASFLTPLGIFTQKTAFVLWIVITNIFVVTSVLLVSSTWSKWNSRLVFSIFISALLFRPYIVTILSGQLVGLFLFVISLALYLWHQDKWFLGGISIGLLNLKPSYGALLLILIGIWLLRIRQNRAIAGIIIINIVLGLIGFLQNSKWLQLFFQSGQRKFLETIGLPPTIWSLSSYFCKGNTVCTGWVGGSLVISLFILYLIVIKNRHMSSQNTVMVVSLAVPLSLLLVPYNWVYDQILLIVSITYITGILQFSGRVKRLPWIFPYLIDMFAIILLFWAHSYGNDMWSLLLPVTIFTIIFFFFLDKHNDRLVGTSVYS